MHNDIDMVRLLKRHGARDLPNANGENAQTWCSANPLSPQGTAHDREERQQALDYNSEIIRAVQ